MRPRPSSAVRWVECMASVRLQNAMPEDQSEDAKEGVAAHWVAAQVLGDHAQLEELTDRPAPNGVIVTGDMLDHVQFYIDTINGATDGAPVIVERSLPSLPGVEDGTPDAYRVSNHTADVWDFKYGYGIVEAVNNWQLGIYIVSLFCRHEWKFQTVTGHIVQPRPYHWQGRVRSWTVTNAEAIKLYHMFERTAQLTQDPNADARTGPHCRYCTAMPICEAAHRAALNAVDVSMQATSHTLTGSEAAHELAVLRRGLDAIKARFDAVEGQTKALLDGGQIVPGWSMQRSYGNRVFLDDTLPVLEAITGRTLTELKPLSPSKVEKLPGVGKELVRQFTTRPETGRKLTPVDVTTKANEVFK